MSSLNIAVVKQQVTKVARTSIELQTGELQRRVTATLENGCRVVMKEGEALFQTVGRYLQQGDLMSFIADDINVTSFKPEGTDREIVLKELRGLKEVSVEAGIWSDEPIEGLAGRTAVDEYSAPRAKSAAPPIGANGQFSAPPIAGAEAAPAPTAVTQF
jgi:hypothetical protein